MRKSIAILFILCSSFFAKGQDNIILKNGDEIKSKVLEISPTELKYKKWNQESPIYSILKKDVFIILYENGTKEVFETEEINYEVKHESKKEPGQKGLSNITELHATNGLVLPARFFIQNVTGYQFDSRLFAGLGVGLNYNFDRRNPGIAFPLFADIRFDFLESGTRPYVSMAGGYLFMRYSRDYVYNIYDTRGGLFFNPSIGLKLSASKNVVLNFGIGYRIQKYNQRVYSQSNYYSNGYYFDNNNSYYTNSFDIYAGIIF
jgi:hypothetical protein